MGDATTNTVDLPWRVGRKVGRTIYAQSDDDLDGVLIGVMDTDDLAARVVADHNGGGVIPGSPAQHSIITPECRTNRSDEGAWDEAVARAKAAYDQIVAGWAGRPEQPTLHLALTIERPSEADHG